MSRVALRESHHARSSRWSVSVEAVDMTLCEKTRITLRMGCHPHNFKKVVIQVELLRDRYLVGAVVTAVGRCDGSPLIVELDGQKLKALIGKRSLNDAIHLTTSK